MHDRESRTEPVPPSFCSCSVDPLMTHPYHTSSCAQVDVKEFKTWIQKWPKGLSKDGYGLPKLMLPVATEVG